jgi:hypothetical protein
MRVRSRLPRKQVVMNGTERPVGMWRIAGVGPFKWILSHRWFFRAMGEDGFRSIYTPKPARRRRKVIPGLDRRHAYLLDDGMPF